MKFKFELTITQVEGLGPGPFEFTVALDSVKQRLRTTDSFEVFGAGTFSLNVLQSEEELGGVSVPIEFFKGRSSVTLPLALPHAALTEAPFIMLKITESEDSQSATHIEDLNSDLDFRDGNIEELTNLLRDCAQDIEFAREQYFSLAAEYSTAIGTSKNTQKSLNDTLYALETQLVQLRTQKNQLEQTALALETHKSLSESAASTKALLSLLPMPSTEPSIEFSQSQRLCAELEESLHSVEHSLRVPSTHPSFSYLESENQGLQMRVQLLQRKLSESQSRVPSTMSAESPDECLLQQLSSLYEKLNWSQQETRELKSRLESYQVESNSYKENIDRLRGLLAKQENENSELSERLSKLPVTVNKNDQIDRTLRGYLKANGLKNPFVKLCEGVYSFRGKRISLSLKNGIPVIRVGGGYIFIDEFIRNYHCKDAKSAEHSLKVRSHSLDFKHNVKSHS